MSDDELDSLRRRMDVFDVALVEYLAAQLHEVYQEEAHRRGDVRHADRYADLSESTKEWDRVLARWILKHYVPKPKPR